jgi:hypothetical protein
MQNTIPAEISMVIHPAPEGERMSEFYTLTANGEPVPVYSCRVSAMPFNQVWPGYQRPLDQTELAAFASIDTAGPLKISVASFRDIQDIVVRPLSKNIIPTTRDHRIDFTIQEPGHFTIEINGWHHAFHLFINPLEGSIPAFDDEDVLYFPPGVHHPGKIQLESHQTVYIAGGAVVYGSFHAHEASDITICGRGIIDVSESERGQGGGAIRLSDCNAITIDGLILRDPDVWCCSLFGCRQAEINNLKLVGLWRYNADGIDICNSRDIHIRDCFVRAFDDNIVFKGLKWESERRSTSYHQRPVRDIVVERCVVWNDWGRAFEIGAETSAPEIANIVFRDCDIIRTTHIAMDIQHGDRALVHDIRFENIRVEVDESNLRPRLQQTRGETYTVDHEDDYLPYLFYIIIRHNYYSKDKELGQVQDILFKDITVNGKMPPSYFKGEDGEHNVERVVIDNLVVNGQPCHNPKEAQLEIEPYVSDVEIVTANSNRKQSV